jgi:NAD(P)-dependent dehydrogenase (short-subunit alcohol dehydrogenase family)
MGCPYGLSADNIESQFASNHVGHFYLTWLLFPIIEETAKTADTVRIVNVSSMAHEWAPKVGIDFDNINNQETYTPFGACECQRIPVASFCINAFNHRWPIQAR